MAVKLHRCPFLWAKFGAHPCWRVQRELEAAGVAYELVEVPWRKSKRVELERLTGQSLLPVVEFEDGVIYREDSSRMAARIKAGKLREADTASVSNGRPTGANGA